MHEAVGGPHSRRAFLRLTLIGLGATSAASLLAACGPAAAPPSAAPTTAPAAPAAAAPTACRQDRRCEQNENDSHNHVPDDTLGSWQRCRQPGRRTL